MALKITPSSEIIYNLPLIPMTDISFVFLMKAEFTLAAPTSNIFYEITGPDKIIEGGLFYNSSTNKQYNYTSYQDSTISVTTQSGENNLNYSKLIGFQYSNSTPRTIGAPYVRGSVSLFVPAAVINPINGGFTQLKIRSSNITWYLDELAIFTNVYSPSVLRTLVNNSPMIFALPQRQELVFYEKFLNTNKNFYRYGGITPTYNNVDFTNLIDKRTTWQDSLTYSHAHHLAPPAGPTEYIIDIVHTMAFSQNGENGGGTEFKDSIRFTDTLGSNIHYKIFEDILRFAGDITNEVKIMNLRDFLFIIENWEKENDVLEPSVKEEIVKIVEEIICYQKDITRNINNSFTCFTEADAYLQSPGVEYGV